ncbi:Protein of unknown function [Quadrisphaera sp. DSM 44207]|nr:Protein of unknown function [Quadrisphaera sp. DSM 44207]
MRRVLRGVYRPAWVELTHPLACRAAGLVAPGTARLTGRSLATVLGVELARPTDPVEMVLPHAEVFRSGGIAVRRAVAGPLGDGSWRGVAVAHPLRMAFDLAARRDTPTATAYLDAVVRAGLVDVAPLSAWLAERYEADVRGVRLACSLVDPRAASVPESRVRVILAQAGIRVAVQHDVVHGGRFVARVDLAVPELQVAVEYDGAWHALREQLERDRRRSNALQAAGWTVVHVTAAMLKDPRAVVEAVRAAIARARAVR